MSLQQILGLFTNQNKYLAHIIVKGVNQDFSGIRQFYQELNHDIDTLKKLYAENRDDVFACLYALKPGLISKDQKIALYTINCFGQFHDTYNWFVSEESKCSSTLLLGFKRHQSLNQAYANLMFFIIEGNQVDYFTKNFSKSMTDPNQLISTLEKLLPFLKNKTLQAGSEQILIIDQLQKIGIVQKWLQSTTEIYQGSLDSKLKVFKFIGEFMACIPSIVEKNPNILNCFRQNWVKYQIIEFLPLFNELLIILQNLANSKSSMSKKLYQIIVGIFNDCYEIEDKKQFIVYGFLTLLSSFPNIPSELFIKNYQLGCLTSSDFILICQAIDVSTDQPSLIKIGSILKDILLFDVNINFYLTTMISEIASKLVHFQSTESLEFLNNLIKSLLNAYVSFSGKSKHTSPKPISDDNYFGRKKSPQPSHLVQKDQTKLSTKKADITLSLCQNITNLILNENTDQNQGKFLKDALLQANFEFKKINFGNGSKKLLSILYKKLKISKQQQNWFQQQKPHLDKSGRLSQSVRKKQSYGPIASLSRIQVPDKITKEFEQIIQRRKKQEENKQYQQMKKRKEEQSKKLIYKKQLQKMNLIKGGFGQGQAQLKQEGFWSKLIKENQEIKIIPKDLIEDIHLEAGDLLLKAYNKLFKYFFVNYSSTMYSTKMTNFDENMLRKQTLSAVQIIKFLKDYKLDFMTSPQQIQTLVKQINVKILSRKETINELDFEGFQQFIKQFCLCIWNQNKVTQKTKISLKFDHFSLPELIIDMIKHLKQVFKSKNQTLSFFEFAEQQNQNLTQQLIEINARLRENPNYILPKDYKKIVNKKIQFQPQVIRQLNINEKYQICVQILDQILFQKLTFHIIQPKSQKVTKTTAKLLHQISVRDRDPVKIKTRALSTLIDRKLVSQSALYNIDNKILLSKSMKKAMLSIKNEDKIIAQQVAFTIQSLLLKIDIDDENKVDSLKKSVQPSKKRNTSHRRLQSLHVIKNDVSESAKIPKKIQDLKKQFIQRKQQKINQQKKRLQQQQLKKKKKKQQQAKYFQQQKQKRMQKEREQQQKLRKQRQAEQKSPSKLQTKTAKQKFDQFNVKQIQSLKKNFVQTVERRKKDEEQKEQKNQEHQQKMRKIRNKIQNDDKFINQIRKETLQNIVQISYGESFKTLVSQYQQPLTAVFQYMQKTTFKPLANKKCKPEQIDYEAWVRFNKIFELSPLIIAAKDVISIFKAVTKEKRVTMEHLVGLTYEQFLHCLLRQCMKQKTIFTKLTDRIRDEDPQIEQINNKKSKPIVKVQPKNQFQQDQQVDVKQLLKQSDIRDDIIDHYGDLSNFNVNSFKGLIYYLRMPFSKKGQQKRVKQLIQIQRQPQTVGNNFDKLREKLKLEYKLQKDEKNDKKNIPIQKEKQQKDIKKEIKKGVQTKKGNKL